jgi:hypothetical protein
MIRRLFGQLGRGPRDDPDAARIRAEGHPGRGTVVSVRPTGRTRDDRREVELTLDVYLGRSRTFRAELRPLVTDAELTRLEPGRAVPVAADHDEPGHVVLAFDMDAVDERAIPGLGPFAGGPGGPKAGDAAPGTDTSDADGEA